METDTGVCPHSFHLRKAAIPRNLQNEIDSLKYEIPAKIEQVARGKYNMKRENEITIDIEEK